MRLVYICIIVLLILIYICILLFLILPWALIMLIFVEKTKRSDHVVTQWIFSLYESTDNLIEEYIALQKPPKKFTPTAPKYIKADPRPEEVQLHDKIIELPIKAFEKERGIFYFEKVPHHLVHQAIQTVYKKINYQLNHKNYWFIYFSHIPESSFHEMGELIRYYYPQVLTPEIDYTQLYSQLKNPSVFTDMLHLKDIEGPCFILQKDEKENGHYIYEVHQLPEGPLEEILASIHYYLEHIKFHQIPRNGVYLSMVDISLQSPPIDPQCSYYDLSSDLKQKIEDELLKNKHNGALKILLYLIENLKSQDAEVPEILKPLVRQLQEKQLYQPSRLVISSTGRLFLPEYNRELELSPIHRTVYIFFLLKEDGILFKDLPMYREDLFRIYSKISNRSSLELMRKTIDDLVNPYNNAMSEKCSRIKEVLIRTMEFEYAKHYIIEGDRRRPKKIKLDRQYIIWEDSFL